MKYLRLMGTPIQIFRMLEPLYNDFSKLRVIHSDASIFKNIIKKTIEYSIIHMDELIDILLRKEECFGIILPYMPKRFQLEQQGVLEPRVSALEIEISQNQTESHEPKTEEKERKRSRSRSRSHEKERKNKENEDAKEEPEEFSVDYWNNIRKKLGMKLLQQ